MIKKMMITFAVDAALAAALLFVATTNDSRVASAIQAFLWPLSILGLMAAIYYLGKKEALAEYIEKQKGKPLFGNRKWNSYNMFSDMAFVALLAYAGMFWLGIAYFLCSIFQHGLRDKVVEELSSVG